MSTENSNVEPKVNFLQVLGPDGKPGELLQNVTITSTDNQQVMNDGKQDFKKYVVDSLNKYTTKVDPTNIEKMNTGAQRSSNIGRGRFDLIPSEAKRRVAIKYEQGALAFGERNWEKGMPFSRLINSAMRHIEQYNEGDRSEDHLAAAVWNLNGIMHFEKYRPDLNDLPKYSVPIIANIN